MEALAAVAELGRAGPVAGELERDRVRELGFPPGQVPLRRGFGQPLALPDGEVGELDGQGRQVGGSTGSMGFVPFLAFAEQDLNRPAVGDEVVQHQRQNAGTVRARGRDAVPQRSLCQVEGLGAGFDQSGPLGRGFQRAEIQWPGVDRLGGNHHLNRLALVLLDSGAQGFVSGHYIVQGACEAIDVEIRGQPKQERNVVERRAAPLAALEPKPLLGDRERDRAGLCPRLRSPFLRRLGLALLALKRGQQALPLVGEFGGGFGLAHGGFLVGGCGCSVMAVCFLM